MKNAVLTTAVIVWLLAAALGSFVLFVYGGYDDAPGAQLLALVIVVGAVALTANVLRAGRRHR